MSALLAILAGGDGQRMGGEKPLAALGGMTLLDRALQWAVTQGLTVAVSLRAADQFPVPSGIARVLDREGVSGPFAGVLGALDHAVANGFNGVVTAPVDAPWLPTDLANRLMAQGGGRAAVALSAGSWHPVCAYWPVAELPRLSEYAQGPRHSLRGALQAVDAVEAIWPIAARDPFANLNDPEALAAAQADFQNDR